MYNSMQAVQITPAALTTVAPANIPALYAEFAQFVDRNPRTMRAYAVNFRAFVAWMNHSNITQPARQDIILYKNWLSNPHEALTGSGEIRHDKHGAPVVMTCKPATVKTYLQAVKMFFKWTAAAGYYPNIADNIHTPKIIKSHKKDALTAGDVARIESTITKEAEAKTESARSARKDTAGRIDRATIQGKRLNAIFTLTVNAGLRTIEISRANVRDYVKAGDAAYIYIFGKGHTEADQKKPIAPEVAAAIDEYLATRDDITAEAPLFVATGNRSGGRRLASTTISTMLKQAMKEAGYNSARLTAHSLRHTAAAAAMAVTGNDIYKTQSYMRHESPATTEIYLDMETTKEDAITARKVYEYYHGQNNSAKGEKLTAIAEQMTEEQIARLIKCAGAILASEAGAEISGGKNF